MEMKNINGIKEINDENKENWVGSNPTTKKPKSKDDISKEEKIARKMVGKITVVTDRKTHIINTRAFKRLKKTIENTLRKGILDGSCHKITLRDKATFNEPQKRFDAKVKYNIFLFKYDVPKENGEVVPQINEGYIISDIAWDILKTILKDEKKEHAKIAKEYKEEQKAYKILVGGR